MPRKPPQPHAEQRQPTVQGQDEAGARRARRRLERDVARRSPRIQAPMRSATARSTGVPAKRSGDSVMVRIHSRARCSRCGAARSVDDSAIIRMSCVGLDSIRGGADQNSWCEWAP